jgi:hypothetical protein
VNTDDSQRLIIDAIRLPTHWHFLHTASAGIFDAAGSHARIDIFEILTPDYALMPQPVLPVTDAYQ